MLTQTYLKWLGQEVLAVKCTLLVALEKRDNLLYIEKPLLHEEYMEKIGSYEEQVLELELEVLLQEKKKRLVQTAINRREPIDLNRIEEQLEEERTDQLNRLNYSHKTETQESRIFVNEEKEELKTLYKQITQDFHPQVHPNLTENQKVLYHKALDAYKRQNLEELRLIYDMLYNAQEDGISISIPISIVLSESTDEQKINEITEDLMEDYSLAAELFPCFEPLEEDTLLKNTKAEFEKKQELVLNEIESILNSFPFIAKETLRNEEKTKTYILSLKGRENTAKLKTEELQREIAEMIGA